MNEDANSGTMISRSAFWFVGECIDGWLGVWHAVKLWLEIKIIIIR